MKWKVYLFQFKKALTPYQEGLLVGEAKGLSENIRKELLILMSKFEKPEMRWLKRNLPGAEVGMDAIKMKMSAMEKSIYRYIKLGKVNAKAYAYCFAVEEFNIINTQTTILSKSVKLKIGNPFDYGDSKILDGFRKIVFPLMLLEHDDYAITSKVMEFTPDEFDNNKVSFL